MGARPKANGAVRDGAAPELIDPAAEVAEAVLLTVAISDRDAIGWRIDEDAWLSAFDAVVANASAAIGRNHGQFERLRSDGMVARVPAEHAASAIVAAVELQMQLQQECLPGCGVGLAYGRVHRLSARSDELVGATVDRSERLAEAAGPGAVLVDRACVIAANMHEVLASVGRPGAALDDLVGPEQLLPVGRTAVHAYVEINWGTEPRGLRPSAISRLAQLPLAPDRLADAEVAHTPPASDVAVGGQVRTWNRDTARGFVLADDGEFLYVDDRFVATQGAPPVGERAWFIPRPALIEGKNRVAACVVVRGGTMAADHRGTDGQVVASDRTGAAMCIEPLGGGDEVARATRFRIDASPTGPVAVPVA
jgi:hypothetical protein